MKVKTIPSTWLEQEGRRLDCGPYLSGAIEAKVLLARLPAIKEPLAALTEGGKAGIYHAGREGRTYVTDPRYGVPFLGSTDILAGDLSWLPLLSKRQVAAHPQFVIQDGWILISRSGTTGRMVYSRSDMAGMACSEHVLRVIPDGAKILPGYLFAFLHSQFGVPLVTFGTYGAVVKHIEPQHILNLPVPRLGDDLEKTVHNKIEESAQLLCEYQAKVKEATRRLFASVGLQDITAFEWHSMGQNLGFTRTVNSSESLRALNFDPRFQQLVAKLASVNHMPLGEICKGGQLERGGRFKRVEAAPEFGVKLIGQREVFWLDPDGRWVSPRHAPDDILVADETVVVAAQGTLGESEVFCRAELITGPWLEFAYSEHLLRVRPGAASEISGAFLFAFLRSETAFRCLRSISTGSKQQDLHRPMLARLPIPIPPEPVRKDIEILVREAYQARHTATALKRSAISDVERAITEGA